jgi:predicted ArsR family transcriptional regulator
MRLLRAIQQTPGRRVADLADECGMPPNTVRDHLRVLEREGLIRAETLPAESRGRPPVGFYPVGEPASSEVATERIVSAHHRGELLRATAGAPAGDVDGAALTQLDVLYEHLDDAGLEPVVDEAALTFEMAPCRYHDMIAEDQALVCSVHARLVSDILRQVDGPLALERLEPFVTAHTCRMLLTRKPTDAPPESADAPARR